MSMTETRIAPTPAKRKPAKRRRKRAAAAATPKPAASNLAGITITKCPSACNAAGCVISGKFYCGHPAKGELQGIDMHNDAAMGRLDAAKKILGKAKIKLPKL